MMGTPGLFEQFAILGVVGLMIVGATQAARQTQRKREMEHVERMKSLEMGLVPQPSGLDWPAATVCVAVGAGVPIGSFLVTWLASMTAEVPPQIWFAPVVVSVSAISASRKLAGRIIDPRGNPKGTLREPAGRNADKPAFDPDAYDVVGSRG